MIQNASQLCAPLRTLLNSVASTRHLYHVFFLQLYEFKHICEPSTMSGSADNLMFGLCSPSREATSSDPRICDIGLWPCWHIHPVWLQRPISPLAAWQRIIALKEIHLFWRVFIGICIWCEIEYTGVTRSCLSIDNCNTKAWLSALDCPQKYDIRTHDDISGLQAVW